MISAFFKLCIDFKFEIRSYCINSWHLHFLKIVSRDLKPKNNLFDKSEHAKLHNYFCFRFLQPLALAKLLQFFDEKLIEEKRYETYKYATIMIGLNIFNVLTVHQFIIYNIQVGMKMRIACSSLIYRKALKLSRGAMVGTTVGQIVNLISNDVSRFDFTWNVPCLILSPIEIVIGMFLIYNHVGWIGLTGAIILLISIPIQCKW